MARSYHSLGSYTIRPKFLIGQVLAWPHQLLALFFPLPLTRSCQGEDESKPEHTPSTSPSLLAIFDWCWPLPETERIPIGLKLTSNTAGSKHPGFGY
ncbi:hypothetical protein BJ875DRAFT_466838 [Amylocarpus encephaloides]|uniref:Uncharacterized protein n=1 Tax=Amylocarpus encephaloides TaxID=45428 RepID=A0A9P7YF99_9HELO|nr:hypothetical protein BJ875DRAFT_466838 [Amylocarpus encephaloides]